MRRSPLAFSGWSADSDSESSDVWSRKPYPEALSSQLFRVAWDNRAYTRKEFKEWYGAASRRCWAEAR